jgi:hypothetical protein
VDEFAVTLHHLSSDGQQAGAQFPDLDLARVSPDKLRGLLEAITRIAPKCEFPAVPELRIAGPHGRFLVQAKNGQVRVTSWSAKTGSADLTPERILALVMGHDAAEGEAAPEREIRIVSFGGLSRRWALVVLALAILTTNGITAWLLTRPPPPIPASLLPPYELVSPEKAKRVFADYAGIYETGTGSGDRRLTILDDGRLKWVRFGPQQTEAESHDLTAQAAESGGRPVLVASNFGMIEMRDPITLVYFGDTYRRKTP